MELLTVTPTWVKWLAVILGGALWLVTAWMIAMDPGDDDER